MATLVKCPTCSRPVEWKAENRWRPFCSQRCKLIDLGQWADGRYAVPGDPADGEDGPRDSGQGYTQ